MKYKAVNKKIATEPFKPVATASKVVNGIAIIDSKITLTGLKVVFGNELAPEGSTVYVPTDVINKHKWAQEKYTIDGKEFILVPEDLVLLVAEETHLYSPVPNPSPSSTGYRGEF